MEKVTTKVLDNTVITASLKEINYIDLIKKCSERYKMCTTSEVMKECEEGFESKTFQKYSGLITIQDLTSDKEYVRIVEYLLERYPYLHIGEISSFLLALLKYELKNELYYFVTDDNRMRKVVLNIHKDILLLSKIGHNITAFKITGTIGLIKRMCERGIISKEDIGDIIRDLENSTFYITPELTKYLRDC